MKFTHKQISEIIFEIANGEHGFQSLITPSFKGIFQTPLTPLSVVRYSYRLPGAPRYEGGEK